MDRLQDPKFKCTYNECKYKVKLWEHQFKKTNGRVPCKLDIREADVEVRKAYKTYYRLKMEILEESLSHTEGFDIGTQDDDCCEVDNIVDTSINESMDSSNVNADDTWGAHLNNNKLDDKINEESKKEKSNINLSFSQKLFAGSKLSKRLPRKSLSFHRKKSNIIKPQFLSQPEVPSTKSFEEVFSEPPKLDNGLSESAVKNLVVPTLINKSTSINLVQEAVNSNNFNCKSSRRLDLGWIQRSTQWINDVSSIKDDEDYNSDDIIDSSGDEQETNSLDLSQIAKKRKIGDNSLLNPTQNPSSDNSRVLITVDVKKKRLDFSNIFTGKPQQTEPSSSSTPLEDEANKNEVANDVYKFKTEEKSNAGTKNSNNKQQNNVKKLRSPKNVNYTEQNKDDNDATTKSEDNKSSKNKPISTQTYELEYSIKPRTVAAPRVNNLKEIISKAKTNESKLENKSKKQTVEDKMKQKVEAGTLNDNYVQINLKKKIYVRGKSTKTFSKYKKQMWKNKKKSLYGPDMDMGGCDGGILTCFNCGQAGHFARHCQKAKGDSLLPINAEDEEECPHLTLEEAEEMARGSGLACRKPNQMHCTSSSQLENNDSSKENETFGENVNYSFNDGDDDDLLVETERLEREIMKIDVQRYIDSTPHVQPYYKLRDDGSVIDTPNEVVNTLRKFGHETFRDGQELAIMRILSGKSTLVTLSTGSGKSLCYQLPAYLYSQREPCISLIISPLVSLMEDQITGIPSFLKAACLHTNQTKVQRSKIMDALNSGDLHILLVSPEAVVAGEKSTGFGSLLRKLPPVAFACIDEAHCVSQWSHNFRPSYLKICRVLKDRLGIKTVLGLTATATRATTDSIIRHLSIPDGRDGVISNVPLPDNLRLTISRDAQRDQALLALILSEKFSQFKSIIVYCTRRDECQRVATFLRTSLQDGSGNKKRKRFSFQAEAYHAGLSSSKRKSIQKAFMTGDLRIVVATVAFGMGINKSDIRAVIHYNMPSSFESYVQEIGRAGRDGLPAHCHVFLDSQEKDENELRRHSYANSTDRHVIRKLLQRCFIRCCCTTSCPRHEVAFSIEETVQALDIPEENIETLLCYLELHEKKYIELLSHAYVTCKIISYGTSNDIRKAAQSCPPLAMALALYQKDTKLGNIFEFPVIEVASVIGWDSGICKHTLKNLEWTSENNQPKRSELTVQFLNLGFHILAPGNLTDPELDGTLDNLYGRVKGEEKTSLMQLHALHNTLTTVAASNFHMCMTEEISDGEKLLKSKIREYFESPKPLEQFCSEIEMKPINEEQIIRDVCSLVCMYRENSFTGRAVARIFHGIQSPNFPAVIWGKCKFWRAHLETDFNSICQIATKEILRLK